MRKDSNFQASADGLPNRSQITLTELVTFHLHGRSKTDIEIERERRATAKKVGTAVRKETRKIPTKADRLYNAIYAAAADGRIEVLGVRYHGPATANRSRAVFQFLPRQFFFGELRHYMGVGPHGVGELSHTPQSGEAITASVSNFFCFSQEVYLDVRLLRSHALAILDSARKKVRSNSRRGAALMRRRRVKPGPSGAGPLLKAAHSKAFPDLPIGTKPKGMLVKQYREKLRQQMLRQYDDRTFQNHNFPRKNLGKPSRKRQRK
jgi:hypothetical protein